MVWLQPAGIKAVQDERVLLDDKVMDGRGVMGLAREDHRAGNRGGLYDGSDSLSHTEG